MSAAVPIFARSAVRVMLSAAAQGPVASNGGVVAIEAIYRLREAGFVERVPGSIGLWQITPAGRAHLAVQS